MYFYREKAGKPKRFLKTDSDFVRFLGCPEGGIGRGCGKTVGFKNK